MKENNSLRSLIVGNKAIVNEVSETPKENIKNLYYPTSIKFEKDIYLALNNLKVNRAFDHHKNMQGFVNNAVRDSLRNFKPGILGNG